MALRPSRTVTSALSSHPQQLRVRLPASIGSSRGSPSLLSPSPCTAWPIRGEAAASEFWPLEATKTAYLSFGYAILRPDAPQTHGHPSREGAIGGTQEIVM